MLKLRRVGVHSQHDAPETDQAILPELQADGHVLDRSRRGADVSVSSATLNPSAPTAPAMPRGKQQANVASALMAAATGVSFSVMRMFRSPWFL